MRLTIALSSLSILCAWVALYRRENGAHLLLPSSSSHVKLQNNSSVVLFTYVFGVEAAEKRYLRLFLESAAVASGVDIVVIGDVAPPVATPVRHFLVSWSALCDRVQQHILDGHDPTRLRQAADAYKIIDFKPLTATLFPELVDGYDWWGHVDNDMLLGDVRTAVQPLLGEFDVISGIPDHPTWGPFTLFRNIDAVNHLFRNSTADLRDLFDTDKPVCFDEWGQCSRRKGLRSMSAILEADKSLKVYRNGFPLTWDGVCKFKALGGTRNPKCATCMFHNGTLLALNGAGAGWERTFLCHYEYAKARLETSLQNETFMGELLETGEFQASFRNGFQTLPRPPPPQLPLDLDRRESTTVLPEPRGPIGKDSIPKVLLATFVFSEEAANKNYLRLFAQTASTSGAESTWIIGDSPPPFPLPPNVHFMEISWDELCNRVGERLGIQVDKLRTARPYKVNDFKPLLGVLFPELVVGYDYWGSCDNDMIVGDFRQLWDGSMNNDFDVLSGSLEHSTWGPITLYRNTPNIVELFRSATISLDRIFNNEKPVCFDEWGSCGFKRWPGASMAGIVDNAGLNVAHVETGWDGWCHLPRFGKSKQRCAECIYRQGGLWLRNEMGGFDEVLVCHYQYTKSRLQSSMEANEIVMSVLGKGEFKVSYLGGFQALEEQTKN